MGWIRGGLGPVRRCAAGSVVAGLVLLATPAVALAGGIPYTGGTHTGGAGGVGVPGKIVTTCTVIVAAVNCTAQVGSVTLTIRVPAGDLPPGGQLVITSLAGAAPAGFVPLDELGIGAFDDGTRLTSAFATPLTATLSGSGVSAATKIFQVSSTGTTATPSTFSGGAVSFSVPADPVYEAGNPGVATTAATTSQTSNGATGLTPAFTGANLIPEFVAGVILLLLGGLLIVGSLRLTRSRQASRAEP
jgi:hypothetical protein